MNPYGTISKPKELLVARGFLKRCEIDYNEIISLVIRLEMVRLVGALTSSKDRSISHECQECLLKWITRRIFLSLNHLNL